MDSIFKKMYTSGDYLENNLSWHVEDSHWKAKQILRMIERNNLEAKSICEVGCGAGEILRRLQSYMKLETEFYGYEVSPQAFSICKPKAREKLHFKLKDITQEKSAFFDLILLIDIIEHLEDPFLFLRNLKSKSHYKILHIPLDLSVQSVIRVKPILHLRKSVGHIQYFTKELALKFLQDTGYELLDYCYTANGTELQIKTVKRLLAKLPRKLFFRLNQDLAVRILGGYSLMVFVR
jgi:SAM-dependent methyltransferase